MDECLHENTREVADMPIADPETFAFLGRFDVVFCTDCETVRSQEPTTVDPPNGTEPSM
jgi:hypothetical protein